MTEHDLLTLEEVAQYLRVSERTVYDWANKGEIPCGKLGTAWRFKRSDIQQWVDSKLAPSANVQRSVNLVDILDEDRVVLFDGGDKAAALTLLINVLGETPQVKNKAELSKEIFERESLMSTGIGFNVAVPHVRLASVTDVVMAMGISRQDISDYASLDEQPVRILCMVAARADQHAKYLKTLGAVSALLKTEAIRQALMNAPDAASAYAILTQ